MEKKKCIIISNFVGTKNTYWMIQQIDSSKKIIEYKTMICERGKILIHFTQNKQIYNKTIKIPTLKNELIIYCHNKIDKSLVKESIFNYCKQVNILFNSIIFFYFS